MKKRMIMVLAMAMAMAVLASGVAQAATQRPLTLTKSANTDSVAVGEPVTFTITEINNQPFTLSEVELRDSLPANVKFVSATPSKGSYELVPVGPDGARNVYFYPGAIASGATATIEIVVIPTEPGTITNNAFDIGENQASASVSVYPVWMPATLGKATVAIAGGAVAIAG
jgi:uncharacterized repeat protein (TIGR01451 family)